MANKLHVKTGALEHLPNTLKKNVWLTVLHASRIPPHVGIIINNTYNSLTIKGHELDIRVDVLLRTIQQKKIETLFVKLIEHPVYSEDYMLPIFQYYIKNYTAVKQGEATCFTPIKLFLQEFYALPSLDNELFFECMDRLQENHYLKTIIALNADGKIINNQFSLPTYTSQELQACIKNERLPYYHD